MSYLASFEHQSRPILNGVLWNSGLHVPQGEDQMGHLDANLRGVVRPDDERGVPRDEPDASEAEAHFAWRQIAQHERAVLAREPLRAAWQHRNRRVRYRRTALAHHDATHDRRILRAGGTQRGRNKNGGKDSSAHVVTPFLMLA